MRMIYNEYGKSVDQGQEVNDCVDDIIIKKPITIHPEAPIMEAMEIMDSNKIGCLPVEKK